MAPESGPSGSHVEVLDYPMNITQAGLLSNAAVLDLFGITGGSLSAVPEHAVVAVLDPSGPEAEELYSLQQNIEQVDIVVPSWIYLDDDRGRIIADIDERQQTRETAKAARSAPILVPAMRNYRGNGPQKEWIGKLIHSEDATQAHFINDLLSVLRQLGADGLAIDIVGLDPDEIPYLSRFVEKLSQRLRSENLLVVLRAPLHDENGLWRRVAASSDYVILYEKEFDWVNPSALRVDRAAGLNAALSEWFGNRDPESIIVEIPRFGASYKGPHDEDFTGLTAYDEFLELLSKQRVSRILHRGLKPGLIDAESTGGGRFEAFVQNAVSVYNEMTLLNNFGVEGVALNGIGFEDASFWDLLGAEHIGAGAVPESLSRFNYEYPFATQGKGEVLDVIGHSQSGLRQFEVNNDGFIVAEDIMRLPERPTLHRWGDSDSEKIVLTFDDGPSKYTPEILDILKSHDVPAVFFAVGRKVMQHTEVIKRIAEEGHEIGNHTFSHPDLANVTDVQMQLELSAVQRALETLTKRNTILFRAPYASDATPVGYGEARVVARSSQLGYINVGMYIDPNDWRTHDSAKIVDSVIGAVERHEGHIVLLHDAGGDRRATVEALPRIIERLRSRGYEFVSLSDFLGLPRGALMPPSQSSKLSLAFQSASLSLYSASFKWATFLLLTAIILGIARVGFIMLLAGVPRRRRFAATSDDRPPRVSVIIPAYNEEKVICDGVTSVLQSDYSNLDFLVVDDGSTDRTLATLRARFSSTTGVRILTKPNGGKASALNYGIREATGEIIVCVDADTHLCSDTIGKLARHFTNPQIGAVAGNAKVGNRVNLITRLQALEYITAQNLDRRAFEVIQGITVVPGAVGAWRRSALKEVGGYSTETVAEDADLTIALTRQGWRVVYEPDAVAWTEAPQTVRALLRQRFRWSYGTLQTLWKHKSVLAEPRSKGLCLGAFPHSLLFQFILPFLAPFADLVFVFALISVVASNWTDPEPWFVSEGAVLLQSYLLFLFIDAAAAIAALIGEGKEDLRLLFVIPLQRLFYRQILYYVLIKAELAAVKGRLAHWDKLERLATVPNTGGLGAGV